MKIEQAQAQHFTGVIISAELRGMEVEGTKLKGMEGTKLRGMEVEDAEHRGMEVEGTELSGMEVKGAEMEVESTELRGRGKACEISENLEGVELMGAKLKF